MSTTGKQGGLVLVLNGTSSAGKSTLVRELQARWPQPLLDSGIDRYLEMLPRHLLRESWPEVFSYRYAGDRSIAEVVPGPVAHDLVRAMHAGAAAVARTGVDVVLDHVVLDRTWAEDLRSATSGLRLVVVAVRCAPDILAARERERGQRTLGQAVAQHPVVHRYLRHDLEVDTGVLDPSSAASAVLDGLAGLGR